MREKFFIETRGCAALMLIAGLLATLLAWSVGSVDPVSHTHGLLFPSPGTWIADPLWRLIGALAIDVVAVMGMFALTRAYNLVRDANYLPAGLFMVLQGATAVSTGAFSGGGLMLITALLSTILFFSIYQYPEGTRRILAVFVMLGAGALTQYGFLPFVIVYFIGAVQMRVMSLRAVVAILAGLLVPAWILLGSGLYPLDAVMWPRIVNPFDEGLTMSKVAVLATVAVTLVIGMVCGGLNMVTVYTRNARTRAFNGLIAGTGIMAGLMCVADLTNIGFYIPVLNLATAYQLSLFYGIRHNHGVSVAVWSLCGLYACLFVWSLF